METFDNHSEHLGARRFTDSAIAGASARSRVQAAGLTSILSLFLLLLAFFIMLNSLAQFEARRTRVVLGSLAATFNVSDPSGQTRTLGFTLFAGPKSPTLMASDEYAPFRSLYNTEDYGMIRMFRWINPLLLWVMSMFQKVVVNWGIAIILLTVLVGLVVFAVIALTARGVRSRQ